MTNINLISPIKQPQDITSFCQNTNCKSFYVYHHKFLNNNFDFIDEFIEEAKKNSAKIYVNFKHNIDESKIEEVQNFIRHLKNKDITGIFINSYAMLDLIKKEKPNFEIIIDSYFDIHNLMGIELTNSFYKIDKVILTEEIYFKNIASISKYTNMEFAIDSDSIPWIAEDLRKLKNINSVVIKGKFTSSEEIENGILFIEKILENPSKYKNQKLPFKHIRKSFYQTNHFSGEVLSAEGKDFKFSRNIIKHEWEINRVRLKSKIDYQSLKIPPLTLRLSSLAQIKELRKLINRLGFNPIKSIEYGEILNTSDLSKNSFSDLINKIKNFCYNNNIQFNLSTPRILIERDFERVFEYVKYSLLKEHSPNSIIINNIGYFWAFINDNEVNHIPIEIGEGINLLNSMSILCLNNLKNIHSIDFSTFLPDENLKNCILKLGNNVPKRKYTIAGDKRIPSLGLCPLNNDSAIVSRLSCAAPCHQGNYALKDPSLNKIYPFVVDGFCRMHMFDNQLLQNYDTTVYEEIGINDFVFGLSSLDAKLLPILIINFLNTRLAISN